ncbi:hypothetical protein B0H19DRAFT_1098180, partial [Mycena capillaripes]
MWWILPPPGPGSGILDLTLIWIHRTECVRCFVGCMWPWADSGSWIEVCYLERAESGGQRVSRSPGPGERHPDSQRDY